MIRDPMLRSFAASGLMATRLTEPAQIEEFIRRIRPVETDSPLIRLGPDGDGGYLLPDDLQDIEACFSPGVSDVAGFEADCVRRGMNAYLADASVEAPPVSNSAFTFTKRFVGATSDDVYMTMDAWVAGSGVDPSTDLILQMDIEGAEYEAILATSAELLDRFRIIIVEFHWLDQLWNRPFFTLARRTFDKLLTSHKCVHIHPNNCCGALRMKGIEMPRVAEMTFLRNDRVKDPRPVNRLPHPLDRPNTDQPPLQLPAKWLT